MSTVNRYWVPHGTLTDQSGWNQDDNEVVLASDFDRLTAERDALQLRLNAADQRLDELECSLRRLERANDKRAGLTTSEAYTIAVRAPGMSDALLELDNARKAARSALNTPQ